MNLTAGNLEAMNVVSSVIIALLAVWALLSPKVKTHSGEVLALWAVFTCAFANVARPVCDTPGQVALNCAIALLGTLYFLRVEIQYYFPRKKKNGHSAKA